MGIKIKITRGCHTSSSWHTRVHTCTHAIPYRHTRTYTCVSIHLLPVCHIEILVPVARHAVPLLLLIVQYQYFCNTNGIPGLAASIMLIQYPFGNREWPWWWCANGNGNGNGSGFNRFVPFKCCRCFCGFFDIRLFSNRHRHRGDDTKIDLKKK